MRTQFIQVDAHREMRGLLALDRKVFRPSDRFPKHYWQSLESYWMMIDDVKAGCCAFETNVDFQQDVREDEINPSMQGSLYVATTGILPEYQGKGLGALLKAWEISYAHYHGFKRIVTNVRRRNLRMIKLNTRFHFETIRTTPRYYSDPVDSTVVMELRLI